MGLKFLKEKVWTLNASPVWVCVHLCAISFVCGCVLEVMRKMLNEVLCVDVISRVHCALGCVYVSLTLLFLYCALQAHVRCSTLQILFFFALHLVLCIGAILPVCFRLS